MKRVIYKVKKNGSFRIFFCCIFVIIAFLIYKRVLCLHRPSTFRRSKTAIAIASPTLDSIAGATTTATSILKRNSTLAQNNDILLLVHSGNVAEAYDAVKHLPVRLVQIPFERLPALCPYMRSDDGKFFYGQSCTGKDVKTQFSLYSLMRVMVHGLYSLNYDCIISLDPSLLILNGDFQSLCDKHVQTSLSYTENYGTVVIRNPTENHVAAILSELHASVNYRNLLENFCSRRNKAVCSELLTRHGNNVDENTIALGNSSLSANLFSPVDSILFSPFSKPWSGYAEKLVVQKDSSLHTLNSLTLEPFHMQYRRVWLDYVALNPGKQICLDLWYDFDYPKTCYGVFPNYKQSTRQGLFQKNRKDDVSVVTQLTFNKLERLGGLAREWSGPVSVALLLTNEEYLQIDQKLAKFSADRIRFHLVVIKSHDVLPYYPINFMRNIAMQFACTRYVFIVDVDFVIAPPDLYEQLVQTYELLALSKFGNKHAFVVPAFEYNPKLVSCVSQSESDPKSCTSEPKTKQSLLQLVNRSAVSLFHSQFVRAHRPTDFRRWQHENKPYYIQWADHFEPYLITGLSDNDLNNPWFDERFVNRGRNKIVFATQLFIAGYKFAVLPNAFLIHSWEHSNHNSSQVEDANFAYKPFFKDYTFHYDQFKQTLKNLFNCHGRADCSKATKTHPEYII